MKEILLPLGFGSTSTERFPEFGTCLWRLRFEVRYLNENSCDAVRLQC